MRKILILISLLLSFYAYAQDMTVRFNQRQMTLESSFREIERQVGLSVAYNEKDLDVNQSVATPEGRISLEHALSQILSQTGYTYKLHKNIILIVKQEDRVKQSQKNEYHGFVLDRSSVPIVGAVLIVDRTKEVAITDSNGKFKFFAAEGDILDVSILGYKETSLILGKEYTNLRIVLEEDSTLLDEVVIVGYGTQKKANITGAVTAIDYAKNAEGRPVLSTSSSLAGLAPGMTVMQGSGRPGSEGATIRIRGIGSFSGSASAPLVLVDGVEWSMDNVNPNDIASISVLKDASSTAIYGTRAANGVILITTKGGSEAKPRISYSYKGIIQNPYNNLEWVSDYAEYMELFNEGCYNAGMANQFSQTDIESWKSATLDPYGTNDYGVPNYVAYPNTNWFKEIFQTGYSQEHNLSVSGGSKKVKYLISGGYLDNQGVMNRFNLDSSTQKANFRTTLEADVLKWFTIGTKIFGQFQQYGPSNIDNGFKNLYMTTPGIYPGSENAWGRPASGSESPNANNIFGHMAGSIGTKRTWRINGSLFAQIRPYKGVSLEGTFNYSPIFIENRTRSRENGYWDYVTDTRYSTTSLENATINYNVSRNYRMSTELLARYNGTFGNHSVGGIMGYSAIEYKTWGWGMQKKGATDWILSDPSTYVEMNGMSSSSVTGWGLRSYFGRINYAFKDRYLFEANIRVDGSSRFAPKNRYGVFPSFSAGWKMHEEPFMIFAKSWLNNLKLRASWGQTGNCIGIGNFAWQSTYQSDNVVLDGVPGTGLYVASMSNINLRWETTTTTDIGLDMGFLKNRLTAELDYYYKATKDILFTPSTYLTMGNVSQVPSNLGKMWNQGFELALNWKDTIGKDFYYYVGANFSYNKNKVTSFKGNDSLKI